MVRSRSMASGWLIGAVLLVPAARLLAQVPVAAGAAAAATPTAADSPRRMPRVHVQGFEVSGNTLLPAADIKRTLLPYLGERSIEELRLAAAAVQALYRAAGYGAVIAYLPAQGISEGRVLIKVLEGRIGQIVVTGQSAHSEAQIRNALPALQPGVTPPVRELDREIRLANENPSRQIGLTLEPGQESGQVDAQVLVTEQPRRRWGLALDNSGNERTGRWRASASYQDAALWGLDHQWSLQYQLAPDKPSAVQVAGLGYRAPVYSAGLMLDAFAAYSDVDGGTTDTAAGPLSFSGRGRLWSLRATGLLQRRGDLDQRLAFSLGERAYLNNCHITGLPDGACGPAGESVTVRPVALEYSAQRDRAGLFSFDAVLTHNLGWGGGRTSQQDFDAVRPGAKRRFTTVRLQTSAARALQRWRLQLMLEGQWSPQALVPGEQFGLTGRNQVRGYEEREVIGDSGARATLELHAPEWPTDLLATEGRMHLLGFADAGQVRNRLDTPCRSNANASDRTSTCSLASVGLGGRLVFGGLQLRLDLAHALRAGVRTSQGDNRVHVLGSYAF